MVLMTFRFIRNSETCLRLSSYLRTFATHRDPYPTGTSSLLASHLERANAQNSQSGSSTVGPFTLGVQNYELRPGEKIKKWEELNAGEKVIRTTARTSNFIVIILGAGLSAVLVYALATELFSTNSPTILYGTACDRIRASPELQKFLHPPLKFHTTPPLPAGVRPRHRNRHVSSQIVVGADGREHLLLNFWIEASDAHPGPSKEREFNWSFDDGLEWTKAKSADIWTQGKRSFALLTGAPLPHPSGPPSTPRPQPTAPTPPSSWSFAGMFSSLRGRKSASEMDNAPQQSDWTAGEAHADYIRDDSDKFVCRALWVDIPNSAIKRPIRVFI